MAAKHSLSEFARALATYMDVMGWNQAQMARAVDVNESTISRWLRGDGQRQESVERVAAKLGMTTAEFLALARERKPEEQSVRAKKLAELFDKLPKEVQDAIEAQVQLWHRTLGKSDAAA